ncbi:hypothetical protein NST23_08505 [Brevibacillus sp. FSL K6-0770]
MREWRGPMFNSVLATSHKYGGSNASMLVAKRAGSGFKHLKNPARSRVA